jgi:hypothetical protein
LYAAVLALLTTAGCEAPPDPRRTNFEVRKDNVYAKYDPKSGRLVKIDVDTNKNGRMDAFSVWDGSRLLRIEVDQNEDGTTDKWEHYDEANRILKLGSSLRGDGVEDAWDYPDADQLLRQTEMDTDRDGVIESRYVYTAPPGEPGRRVLIEAQLNIDDTGKPGQIVYYRPDGTTIKTEMFRPLPPAQPASRR